jgi:hypothetical protein
MRLAVQQFRVQAVNFFFFTEARTGVPHAPDMGRGVERKTRQTQQTLTTFTCARFPIGRRAQRFLFTEDYCFSFKRNYCSGGVFLPPPGSRFVVFFFFFFFFFFLAPTNQTSNATAVAPSNFMVIINSTQNPRLSFLDTRCLVTYHR